MTEGEQRRGDLSILVIDDDPAVRMVLADYLESEGYRVRAESCGETGLATFTKEGFDVVVTDLRMPGLGGLEVVRRVKEKDPEAEVIVITGYATIQDGVEAMRDGAYDFLLKPVRVDQIDAVLDRCARWIRHRRSHKELEAVNRKLLELTRMKERFLAVTDHELRTPVTVLDGMLGLLMRQNPDLPESVRERLESLTQVSRRLVHLVRDIHDLVQSRSHRFPVEPRPATVADLLRSVKLDFEIVGFNRGLSLSATTDLPEGFSFSADIQRLRQAVSELVQNAVKATSDEGRVEVRIFAVPKGDATALCVAVCDTGVGISAEEQSKIFEIFYGVGNELYHHTSKFEFMGSGLGIGLSIALEIAKAHGGGIDLESTEGQGATFTLWIPTLPAD